MCVFKCYRPVNAFVHRFLLIPSEQSSLHLQIHERCQTEWFFLFVFVSSSVLPAGLRLNALTVVTVLCCHHFPNGVFTAAFLLLTLRLSVLLWHPCTVGKTVQDAIVSSVFVCLCVCVHACACVYVCACMCALLVYFVHWLYIPSHVYVCIFACLASSDNCEWMAEFVYLVLPEARFHFGHRCKSQPFSQTKGSWFLGRKWCPDRKKNGCHDVNTVGASSTHTAFFCRSTDWVIGN